MNIQHFEEIFKKNLVTPDKALEKIEPGMSLFIGTGVAEPRTMVKQLMQSHAPNIQDLELIQVVSLGDVISAGELSRQKFRLKTFFSGWVADAAISSGLVDYVPSRYSEIPGLFRSGHVTIDAAIIQITPPNEAGYCSLGVAVDVARHAMEKASLVIGEINENVPMTFGDTFVHITQFDRLIQSNEAPIYFDRWPIAGVFDKIAANIASIIENGSCMAYSVGPLFESLGKYLCEKKNLGIHSPFFTDALMDLVKCGAVTNRCKKTCQGKALTSYAVGTQKLMRWLDGNPLVEFQSIDKVFSPIGIGKNPHFTAIIHARKIDLQGRVVLYAGKGNVATGPVEVIDLFNGAEISKGGRIIVGLASRNLNGESNIRLTIENYPNQFGVYESVNLVVTEFGIASLKGRSIRERAQALIEIAHPDDRAELMRTAKANNLIYRDQIFMEASSRNYPHHITSCRTFQNNLKVRFRALKPSDEEAMRRLFYRFSKNTVYYRYFTHITAMPHSKMQEYVNVDYQNALSIVGVLGTAGEGRIVAEARYVLTKESGYAEIAFVVDEAFQGIGLASHMYDMLRKSAKEQGIAGFTANVLATNQSTLKALSRKEDQVTMELNDGVYEITITFSPRPH